MIQGKWFAPGQDLSEEIVPIRERVFGYTGNATDPEGWNALVCSDGEPAACGRIWWEDGFFRIGEIGVVPSLRGKRLGDLVLRLLLFKAQSHAASQVWLISPAETEGFFSRLGFKAVNRGSGSVEMMIYGKDISLDSCANCRKQNCPNRQP